MNNFLNGFIKKCKRWGFTLAEALVVTVMAGYAILPILGTMQNASKRAEAYDHRSKMVQYTRSRLTKEIANASFDHCAVSTEDMYHYIVYFDPTGDENKAVRMEIPETYINPDELLTIKGDTTVASGVCDLFGLNSDITPSAYIQIIYAYRTSVQTNDGILLATYTEDISSTTTSEPGPKGLLGIVVTTRLVLNEDIPYDDDGVATGTGIIGSDYEVVEPVSNFSLVNLPTVSDEYIWLCDSRNLRLISIDPISKTVASTIALVDGIPKPNKLDDKDNNPYRPWHIAVHPSGKVIAVQYKQKIVFIDIDKKSSNYGLPISTDLSVLTGASMYCDPKENPDDAPKDGGIVFRPDGKFLFVTQKSSLQVLAYKTDIIIDSSTKTLKTVSAAFKSSYSLTGIDGGFQTDKPKETAGFVAGSDGYLYLAFEKDNGIIRLPMYCDFENGWSGERFLRSDRLGNDVKGIAISPNGKNIAVGMKVEGGGDGENEGLVKIFDTQYGLDIASYSVDSIYKIVFSANSSSANNGEDIASKTLFINSSVERDKNLPTVDSHGIGNCDDEGSLIYNSEDKGQEKKKKGGLIIASPIIGETVMIEKEKSDVYFVPAGKPDGGGNSPFKLADLNKIAFSGESADSGGPGKGGKGGKGGKKEKLFSDLVANTRDILAVSHKNTSDDGGSIILFDLNTMKKIEDGDFIATHTPKSLAMSANGDMLIGAYGPARKGNTRFYLRDYSLRDQYISGEATRVVVDDRSQNMIFALEGEGVAGSRDCTWNMDWDNPNIASYWAEPKPSAYNRQTFHIESDDFNEWHRYDMIGLPRGGYLALLGKENGTSMIEWVGRIPSTYTENPNKYRLFARWVSVVDGANTTLPGNINLTGSTLIDNWQGRIAVCKEKFPVGSVITSLTASIGTDSDWSSSEIRFITPVILQGNINTSLKIVDYATPIGFSKTDGTVTRAISGWPSGGKIAGDDYYVGFYSGNRSSSICKGAIEYAEDSSGFTYVADYHVEGTGDDETAGQILPSDIAVGTNLVPHGELSDKKRKYALAFTAETTGTVGFPPAYSKALAMSSDMGTLAILSGKDDDATATPTISLFDFNNFNFLNETQIEGMLVDYREKFQSGIYDESTKELKTAPVYPWPNEEESLFKSVLDEGRIITDFKSVTTKYDTFTPFNQFPANYFVNTDSDSVIKMVKGNANKRVFGYISDDKDFTNLQGIPSEDSRFFYNNKILGGRLEQSSEAWYEPSLYIGLNPYQSGLLQLDQTSNGQKNRSAIFLGKKDAGSPSSYLTTQGDNKILNEDYSVCGWNTLRSDQTYILKNHPTFMKSFVGKAGSSLTKIGIASTTMRFSRDRAKPVLYIADGKNKCLWALGEKATGTLSLIKVDYGLASAINGTIEISKDGSKLLLGDGTEATATNGANSANKSYANKIIACNISNPQREIFHDYENSEYSAPSSGDGYLAVTDTLPVDNAPSAMAAMPFVSYSSSAVGGNYNLISNTAFLPVNYNGCMAVASGGIYIFPATTNNASRTILLYNPADSKATALSDVLKAPAPYSPITCYDDTLYIMGDDNTGETPTNRVQSFNVNTRKAKASLINEDDAYNDEYMVNYLYNDDTKNLFTLRKGESGFTDNDPKDIFDNDNSSYFRTLLLASSGENNKWVTYTFKSNIKVTVNKVIIHNHDISSNNKLKDWVLYGGDAVPSNEDSINYASNYNLVLAGACATDNDGPHEKSDKTAGGAYSTYLLYLKSAKDGGSARGVSNLELWRTGVKRLTPQLGSQPSGIKNKTSLNSSMVTNCEPFESMTWSSASTSEYNLSDIFTENKQYSNNKNYISTSGAGYESNKAKPWIITSFKKQEAVCAVRYANAKDSNKSGVRVFRLYGSNDSVAPSATDTTLPPSSSAWVPIGFAGLPDGNDGEFTGPNENAGNTYITAEIKNPTPYKHYLFQVKDKTDSSKDLRLVGFEMFSSNSRVAIDDDYLTGLETDDRGEVNVGAGACCATPYGLVYTGGHVDGSGANYATNTALLYWPHAIDKYDGTYYKNGISRSLPSLGQARFNHAMVWHKGRLYVLGGAINEAHELAGSDGGGTYAEYLDGISSGALQWVPINQSEFKPVSADITVTDMLGFYQGVCSYGDEIFIFGGQGKQASGFSAAAYAWNPETGRVRKLRSLPEPSDPANPQALSPCSAVVFGSKIYIYGMNNSASPARPVFFEYTP